MVSAITTAMGLLVLREGIADFAVNYSSIPLLVVSFLPNCPLQFGRSDRMPEVGKGKGKRSSKTTFLVLL